MRGGIDSPATWPSTTRHRLALGNATPEVTLGLVGDYGWLARLAFVAASPLGASRIAA